MNTYIILSRFSPEAFDNPKHFLELAEQVSKKIREECPGIRWKDSYATLGTIRCRRCRGSTRRERYREGSHDYSSLWQFDYGNITGYTLEGVPFGAVTGLNV